jgi:hypothetical protein
VDNEIRSPTTNWDFEFVGTKITIRSAPRQISLIAELRPGVGITFTDFRIEHRDFVLIASGGWIIGVSAQFAFEAREIEVTRVGGTVVHFAGHSVTLGKAPAFPSLGSMKSGVLRGFAPDAPDYRRLAAMAAKR